MWPSVCDLKLPACAMDTFAAEDVGLPFHCCPSCDEIAQTRAELRALRPSGAPRGAVAARLLHPMKWDAIESQQGWEEYQRKSAVAHATTFGNCSREAPGVAI